MGSFWLSHWLGHPQFSEKIKMNFIDYMDKEYPDEEWNDDKVSD